MVAKALPTKYGSTQYRSRLEARWAMFFDLMGIEYIYEPAGYDLGRALPEGFIAYHDYNKEFLDEEDRAYHDSGKLTELIRSKTDAQLREVFNDPSFPTHIAPRCLRAKVERGYFVPDFYLPQFRMFTEVKPCYPTDEQEEKCIALAFMTAKQVLLLVESPSFNLYSTVAPPWLEFDQRPIGHWGPQSGSEFQGSLGLDIGSDRFYDRTNNRFIFDPEYPEVFDELNLDHLGLFSEPYREAVRQSRFYQWRS